MSKKEAEKALNPIAEAFADFVEQQGGDVIVGYYEQDIIRYLGKDGWFTRVYHLDTGNSYHFELCEGVPPLEEQLTSHKLNYETLGLEETIFFFSEDFCD